MSKNNIRLVTCQPSNAVTEEYSSRYKGIDNLYDYILIVYILLLIEKRFNLDMTLFNVLRIIRGNLLKTYVLKNIFLRR